MSRVIIRGDEWPIYGSLATLQETLKAAGVTVLTRNAGVDAVIVDAKWPTQNAKNAAWLKNLTTSGVQTMTEEMAVNMWPPGADAPAAPAAEPAAAEGEEAAAPGRPVRARRAPAKVAEPEPAPAAPAAGRKRGGAAAVAVGEPAPAAVIAAAPARKRGGRAAAAAAAAIAAEESESEEEAAAGAGGAAAEKRGLAPDYKKLAYAGGEFPEPADGEKRVGAWRKVPTDKTRDRLARAKGQRMFLVERRATDTTSSGYDFSVLGTTGNLYTVAIDKRPRCNCPDARRGNVPCKHVMFVIIKVLRIPPDSPLVWQSNYMTHELQYIFEHAPDPTRGCAVLANDRVRAAARAARGEGEPEPEPDAADADAGPKLDTERKECTSSHCLSCSVCALHQCVRVVTCVCCVRVRARRMLCSGAHGRLPHLLRRAGRRADGTHAVRHVRQLCAQGVHGCVDEAARGHTPARAVRLLPRAVGCARRYFWQGCSAQAWWRRHLRQLCEPG